MSDKSDRCVEEARVRLASGVPLEAAIATLRNAGVSKVESIHVLSRLGMPLRRAKEAVHNSEAWADERAAHDAFHDELFRVAEDEGLIVEDGDE